MKGKDFRSAGQTLRLIKASFPPEAASTLFREVPQDMWVLERKDEGHGRKARGRWGHRILPMKQFQWPKTR